MAGHGKKYHPQFIGRKLGPPRASLGLKVVFFSFSFQDWFEPIPCIQCSLVSPDVAWIPESCRLPEVAPVILHPKLSSSRDSSSFLGSNSRSLLSSVLKPRVLYWESRASSFQLRGWKYQKEDARCLAPGPSQRTFSMFCKGVISWHSHLLHPGSHWNECIFTEMNCLSLPAKRHT